MYKLGMDLGGTKIEGIILDGNNKEIFRKRIGTEQEKGYEHILNNISILYKEMANEIGNDSHTFGIGTPGSISSQTGLLKNSNTICLNGKPFISDLENKIGHKVAMENDANCFAMAEAIVGAGKGKKVVFGVIMGTGCGGGLVFNGEVVTGLQSIAGEWGHATIDPRHGPSCYCGKRGCIETFISGTGVQNRYQDLTGENLPLKKIMEMYRSGTDLKATKIINDFFENYGIAIANLINILDPDIIVLGGGLSNIDEVYSKGLEEVKKNVFNDVSITPIVKNQMGDSAGVLGAALIGIK